MSDTHFYEPSKGHGLAHCAFKAIVAPRPIGWFSTVDEAGNMTADTSASSLVELQ